MDQFTAHRIASHIRTNLYATIRLPHRPVRQTRYSLVRNFTPPRCPVHPFFHLSPDPADITTAIPKIGALASTAAYTVCVLPLRLSR